MKVARLFSKTAALGAVLALGVFLGSAGIAQASDYDAKTTKTIYLVKGELVTLGVKALTRISVADPLIADIADASDSEVLLAAKDIGQTALFIWDESGKKTVILRVFSQNLDLVKERINDLLKEADISEVAVKVFEKEGKIVVSGDIPEDKKDLFDQLVASFDEDIIVMAQQEKSEDLIEIDVQITELNTTLSRVLGVDWTTLGNKSLALTWQETLPTTNGRPEDYFKVGDFNRTSEMLATVNALIQEGKARILSKPKVVVLSGDEASFLVGGEIPIRTTTTSSGGSTQENVSYKSYGVNLVVTPKVRKHKVDTLLQVEVSDVDDSNYNQSGSDSDVAFITRNATTRLFLDHGQTIVLAGLIKAKESEIVKKVPFLGSIPIIGALFRTVGTPTPNQDTELVISLTPYILPESGVSNITDLADKVKDLDNDSIRRTAEEKKKAKVVSSSGVETNQPVKVDITKKTETVVNKKAEDLPKGKDVEKQEKNLSGIPSNMADYVKSVQQKIAKSIVYPPEAQAYGWEGRVTVGLLILRDGTLAFTLVKESSGYAVFDNQALKTVKTAAPFAAFPKESDLQEINITIPIAYTLTKK